MKQTSARQSQEYLMRDDVLEFSNQLVSSSHRYRKRQIQSNPNKNPLLS